MRRLSVRRSRRRRRRRAARAGRAGRAGAAGRARRAADPVSSVQVKARRRRRLCRHWVRLLGHVDVSSLRWTPSSHERSPGILTEAIRGRRPPTTERRGRRRAARRDRARAGRRSSATVGASGDVGRGGPDDRDCGPSLLGPHRAAGRPSRVASRCAASAIGQPDGQLDQPAERWRAEPLPQRQLGVVEGGPVAARRGQDRRVLGLVRLDDRPARGDRRDRPGRSPGRAAGTSAPRRARRAGSARRRTRRPRPE